MQQRYVLSIVCFALVSWSLENTGHAQSSHTIDPQLAAAFQAVVDAQVQTQSQYGAAVAVSMPDGGLWAGASGFDDPNTHAPLSADMRFGFASITKTFVSAVIMQLVEEGVLTLDDRLNQWLPVYPRINSAITIRHLLGHTSGIYNYTNNPDLWPALLADPAKHWTPDELVRTFVKSPAFFMGQGGSYSNTNYILLGMIIEKATGTSVSVQFRQRLLDPHGLGATYLSAEEEPTGQLAKVWFDYNSNGRLDDFSAFYQQAFHSIRWTTGGMYSTPENIALWAKALYAGEVLMPASRDTVLNFHALAGTNAVWTGYGFGAQQYQVGGIELWGHSGLIAGSASLMVYSPEYDISVALVDNAAQSNHFAILGDLLPLAVEAASRTSTHREAAATLPEALVLEGTYPNPFSASTTIAYRLTASEVVHMTVHNALGQMVKTLVNTVQPAGPQRVIWDGTDAVGQAVAPGVYLYTVVIDEQVQTGKAIVIR